MDKIALVLFFAVIILAFTRKVNAGILSFAIGMIAVRMFGMTDKDILNGISGSMFSTLVSINLLFAIVSSTGALELLARKIVALSGKKSWILPIAVYVASFVISAMTGAIPALAIIPALAVSVAIESGFHPIMLAMFGACGWSVGRMTPITPEGVIISSAAESAGLEGVMFPIMLCQLFATIIFCIILYIVFKGYKVKLTDEYLAELKTNKFTAKQLISLASVVVMLGLIVFAKINIGIAAFVIVALLLLFNFADEKALFKAMPWGTIVLVLGVGALLDIVNTVGGLDLVSNALSNMMTKNTAAPIMGICAGLLSLVSSSTGVVYPTMMPMCAEIAATVGTINPVALMAAVGLGSSMSGVSPMSVAGALMLSAMANSEKYSGEKEQRKAFVLLIAIAVISLVAVAAVAVFFNGIVNLVY